MSSITYDEYVGLKATLHAIDNRHFLCGECKMRYAGMPTYEQQSLIYRESKGCITPFPTAAHRIGSELAFKRCIGNYFDFSVINWMEAERAFERGTMPYTGTLMDQPNKVIEVFRLISNHRNERQAELNKQEMRKQKAANGRR